MSVNAAGKMRGRIARALVFSYAAERCIAAAVLTAVLAAGLFVRAPWRVNAVLAVLLANTVLSPWKLRLVLDMAVACVVAIGAVWVLGPNVDYGRWEPYRFSEDVARAEALRAVRPEENAAEVYKRLFAAYDPDTFDSGLYGADGWRESLVRGWRDKELPGVKKWCEEHAEGFALLTEAASMPQCRFALATTEQEQDAQKMRTNLMRRWALALVCAANNDLEEGRRAEAIEKVGVLRRMSEHSYQQQMLFDRPRGAEVERMADAVMSRLIIEYEPTDEELGVMQGWFRGVEETLERDWPRVYEHQKLYVKQFAGLLYEVNEQGQVRCSRHALLAIDHQFRMGLQFVRHVEHAPRLTAAILWFTIPHQPERAGREIDRIFATYFYDMTRPGGEDALRRRAVAPYLNLNYKGLIELQAWRAVNWIYPLADQEIKRLACRDAGLVLIALKRYERQRGEWPESLERMVESREVGFAADRVNGGRLVYRKDEKGFVLYSEGKNGLDDGGRNDPFEGTDDLGIWPPSGVLMLGAAPIMQVGSE